MQNSTLKNILVIDNHDSFVYNLVQILRENEHCQFDIVQNDRIDFSSLDRYDKLLLSPGPGIPAEAGDLLALIEHCKTTQKAKTYIPWKNGKLVPLPKPSVPAYNN